MLPDAKKGAIGFGGLFKNKIINHPVNLIFGSQAQTYKVTYGSGFQIICIPSDADPHYREQMLRYNPCVLGMEILGRFLVCVDKRKVELTVA